MIGEVSFVRFQDQPSSNIYTSDYLRAEIEAHITLEDRVSSINRVSVYLSIRVNLSRCDTYARATAAASRACLTVLVSIMAGARGQAWGGVMLKDVGRGKGERVSRLSVSLLPDAWLGMFAELGRG